MKIVFNGKKWVLYDSKGKVVVITTLRSICERMVKSWKKEK